MAEVLGSHPDLAAAAPKLQMDVESLASVSQLYDEARDLLLIYKTPKVPAVSWDVAGDLWLRYLPDSGEVVGVEIEDFERVFLAKHRELQLSWQTAKPHIARRTNRQQADAVDYIRLLLLFIRNMLKDNPYQERLVLT